MRIACWGAVGAVVIAATSTDVGQVAWSATAPSIIQNGATRPKGRTAQDTDGVIRPSGTGMVKPGSVVDPGMTVIHPRTPSAGTPVLKPKTTAPDGSVVVPR